MITIQNTDGDRRVLLLDSSFALDESPDFPEYLFDVVFIVNDTVEETKAILNSINPITSTKCCYKPLFDEVGEFFDEEDYHFSFMVER
ncbi:MAG: hypothetical protein K2H04_08510 [Bacteroidaceae bacterium]|nr:hypothetical protein [Bacteroidaceae bacterium]